MMNDKCTDEKNKIRISCGNCDFLKTIVGKKGMIPECVKGRLNFPERTRINYQEDEDLRDQFCGSFKLVGGSL